MPGTKPPSKPPHPLPDLVRQTVPLAWRLHRGSRAIDPTIFPTGKFRFDAPAGEYPVTYANLDEYAPFNEVFGDLRSIPATARDTRFARIEVSRPLRLVAIDDPATLAAFDLDLQISASRDYDWTRRWSLAWHRWYPDADGIRYLGRHAAGALNLCLYVDRCGDALTARDLGALPDLPERGLEAARRFRLAPLLYL